MKNIDDLTLEDLEHLTPELIHEVVGGLNRFHKTYDSVFIPKGTPRGNINIIKPPKRSFDD